MKKKGVSPAVATVLLIGIVIALSAIVFFWFRSFIHESNLKFGEDISLSCPKTHFIAKYSNNELQLSNTGNVPIYSFNVQINGNQGSYSTIDLSSTSGITWHGLSKGQSDSVNIQSKMPSQSKSLIVVPILKGALNSGQQQAYPCDIAKYGQTVTL